MSPPRHSSPTAGFTLIEVIVSMAVLVTIAAGVAQLFALGITATRTARDRTSTAILAAAKLEQLRSLQWTYERAPPGDPLIPLSDNSTDISVEPPAGGGPGLFPSPSDTLDRDVPPYVDFLDAEGRVVGNGSPAPRNAVFVRRWAVRPLPDDPDHALILQVLVATARQERARRPGAPRVWTGEDAVLVTILARKSR